MPISTDVINTILSHGAAGNTAWENYCKYNWMCVWLSMKI